MKIIVTIETPYATIVDKQAIELDDDATDEEIEEAAREVFFERYQYSWEKQP